ncbi:MAG: formate dehydrogenase accessory sulfurtransferase FdhD [Bacillota bacterium]|nr:formate dehydrogenase accessory sulfurtransferase FdhD [Bacillota bacterium]
MTKSRRGHRSAIGRDEAADGPPDAQDGGTAAGTGPGAVARRVLAISGGAPAALKDDLIARELHLRVVAHGVELAALACSPVDLDQLVLGFLFSNGYIDRPEQVASLTIDAERAVASASPATAVVELEDQQRVDNATAGLPVLRFVASGCGSPPPPRLGTDDAARMAQPGPAHRIGPSAIVAMARNLQRCSPLFGATGGVHAAALAGPLPEAADLLVVREDIGRHNAVDKVTGWALATGTDPADKVLLVTGRLSAEIVAKAARLGVPVVLSRSAPTDLAVEAADAADITLIGFARADRANVYCNWWRIVE